MIPLIVAATDFATGEEVELTRGNLVEALLASRALPGVFPPVEGADGRLLIDGALSDSVPLRAAAERGAPRLFCVPCECCVDRTRIRRGFLGTIGQALFLLRSRAKERQSIKEFAAKLGVELLLVEPRLDIPAGGPDLRHTVALISRGYAESLSRLRPLVLEGAAGRTAAGSDGPAAERDAQKPEQSPAPGAPHLSRPGRPRDTWRRA